MNGKELYPEAEIKMQIDSILKYSKCIYDRRLVSAIGGNVSVRCPMGVLITAGNAPMGELSYEDIVLCELDGTILRCPEGKKPSKEMQMHLSVYRSRQEVNGIIHAHPNYCTAFTAYDQALPLFTASAKFKLGMVPTIEAADPGSAELAEYVDSAVRVKYPHQMVYLMKAHGSLALGEKLLDAFYITELLEDTAKIALLAGRVLM